MQFIHYSFNKLRTKYKKYNNKFIFFKKRANILHKHFSLKTNFNLLNKLLNFTHLYKRFYTLKKKGN